MLMTSSNFQLHSRILKTTKLFLKKLDQSRKSRYYTIAEVKANELRMSYSGNTLAFQAKARGSIPLIRLHYIQ